MNGYEIVNIEAEQMTLGSIIKSPETMDDISAIVTNDDFSEPVYNAIFATALDLHAHNELDYFRLRQALRDNGVMNQLGGASELAALRDNVASASLGTYYAGKVRESSILRAGIRIADEIKSLSINHSGSIDDYITAVNGKINGFGEQRKSSAAALSTIAPEYIEQKLSGEVVRSPTMGLTEIDLWMRGIGRNRLISIAGRPGAGKTALALRTARKISIQGYGPVYFASMEMDKSELMDRMASDVHAINFSRIQTGDINDEEKSRMERHKDSFGRFPIIIDDTPRMDVHHIMSECRKLKREHGSLGAIVIDYLGLIQRPHIRGESEADSLGKITRELKLFAKEIGCSIILLVQMSRDIEKRNTKRPVMSDLKGSGSIEADSDMVIFLNRDDEKSSYAEAVVEFIVAKGRQTGIRDFKLRFIGQFQRIEEPAK